ncbi:cytochrome P450 [Rhodococcus sp. 05-340-1]|uniref:cytochrome P450 n=1 Tax=Nocardiaceae TaxID=85025 RepID=UPI00068F723C|nr:MULTISPECIES: cytochrome P450 [Rhodococcus]OZC87870.1 cytochrome P450 [Rhodococcus sp. 06-412-2C]OZC96519.1 cytochrome P450 [Rhodococcus sp. 06-412-2B]OZD65463.1 cytochrome P450 [Rhodococcus sp. 05-340-2]OZD74671.1 cytochrome P450 [Rhodococcus sp. 05-340-1]OZD86750.1 cytochrome P450 [Rhodococcus sp. 05-339-2]
MRPSLDLDLYGRKALESPLGTYRSIRDTGSAVWLSRHRMWAIGRYADVRAALRNDAVFASGKGIAANRLVNSQSYDTVICSDGETHTRRRRAMLEYLGARKVAPLENELIARAEVLVDDLVSRKDFDAVSDFASVLPVEIVADLLGVTVKPSRLLRWGASTFDAAGPINIRSAKGLPNALRLKRFGSKLRPSDVAPHSWAAKMFEAADAGKLTHVDVRGQVIDFMAPSLDTTILASAEMLRLLGERPELWDRIREDNELIGPMVAEAVRLSSPIRAFTRVTKADVEVGTQLVPGGSRVVLLYGSANRDERQFENPDTVDLSRSPNEQIGWGVGAHACAGMHLARLEMRALLTAMVPRVRRVTLTGPGVSLVNNTLQGLVSQPAAFD